MATEDFWFQAEPNEVERRRKDALIEHNARIGGVLKSLAKTKDGRYFLRWIMEEAGAFKQDYPHDERAGMWAAGRRALGLQIFAQCAAHNIASILMEKENIDV